MFGMLTKAERKYRQVEKDRSALTFTTQMPVHTVLTDYKPLLGSF